MTASTLARLAGFSCAALALFAAPLSAATLPNTATYQVQSVIETDGTSLIANELLSISSLDGRALVTLVQQNTGEAARLAAPIDTNGVLGIVSPDPALTCYNTAQAILVDANTNAGEGTALAVSFGGNDLAIPLHFAAATSSNGVQDVKLAGRIEGTIAAQPRDAAVAIVVDGSVRTQQHQLLGIQLHETTVLTATHATIGKTSCSISRVIEAAPGVPV
jgi:hypothetical protein